MNVGRIIYHMFEFKFDRDSSVNCLPVYKNKTKNLKYQN